jgi:hypothetical protein
MQVKLIRFSFVGDEVFQDAMCNGSMILRTVDLSNCLQGRSLRIAMKLEFSLSSQTHTASWQSAILRTSTGTRT